MSHTNPTDVRLGRKVRRGERKKRGGWGERGFLSRQAQHNPVCRSGAWSLAAAAAGIIRPPWLEAPLCSSCCGMLGTYYAQLTSSHPRFMQINVRPRDIWILGSPPPPIGAVEKGPQDSICPCRFMLIRVSGFMGDSFVMWLHSVSQSWHLNVTAAGWSILRLFYSFFLLKESPAM